MNDGTTRAGSIFRFDKARRQAKVAQVTARLTGRDPHMLPFDEIRSALRQQSPLYQGIQDVPVDHVVGSVGRYREFTRTFLPLKDSLRERWIGVDTLARAQGWLPIELYQIGDVYFVQDGNHRLSVARQMALPTIEAHVWTFPDDVVITPDDKVDAVLIRLEARNFMEKTGLAQRHPEHTIAFTSPGRYGELLAQIADLREKLAQIDGERMDYADAVDAWYEMVYLPTVEIIRDSTLLDEFAGRTEADLFVWVSLHREGLRDAYGRFEHLSDLVQLLAEQHRPSGVTKLTRQVKRLLGDDALPPLAETAVGDQDA